MIERPDSGAPPGFYIVAREPGAEHPAIPTWANEVVNPAGLAEDYPQARISRVEVARVPGAFQLLGVLSAGECERLVALTEALGYCADAAVSLPRRVRHNHNATWVVDEATDGILWQRSARLVGRDAFDPERRALGFNARLRFYRYRPGDYFAAHTDGAWPGSRVVERRLVSTYYTDRWSRMTVLLFLSDDYAGGETRFWIDREVPGRPARSPELAEGIDVRTPAGGVLFFPHGEHPQHCLHGSMPIESGTKYIARTDLLFEL